MQGINTVSLFDGISCGRAAFDRAKIPLNRYAAYEIDPDAIKVSQKNWSDIERYGDVTTADFTQYQGFDILIGGSPCQGFSFAGKQLNFDDPRSKLFFEFARAVKEVQPKYILFENTPMRKEYVGVIDKYLGFESQLLNSKLVSAQDRKRLYWVGERNADGTYSKINIPLPEDKGITLEDIVFPDVLLSKDMALNVLNAIGKDKHIKQVESEYDDVTFKTIELSNIYGGFGEKRPRVHLDKSVTIRTAKGGGHIPSFVLADYANGLTLDNFKECIRKANPVECERLQTLPDGYTEGISPTARYRCVGNGWTVDMIAWILHTIFSTKM